MNNKIKVGFCVAYDWYLLKHSLPLIYDWVDIICLSIDKDHISWANNSYAFDESSFVSLVKTIDTQDKITVYSDNFHIPELSPMENEVRQRNMMSKKMEEGGWHIQLDCDEYFVNFKEFTAYLKGLSNRKSSHVNICCQWITLFKQTNEGFFFVSTKNTAQIESIQVATKHPNYTHGRRNGNFNLHTNFQIIHQSWARTEAEILKKLNNWGHKNDFSAENYLKLWNSVNANSYSTLRNLHPIHPNTWPALGFSDVKSIEALMGVFQRSHFSFTAFQLSLKNNRNLARIKSLFKKLFY